MLMASDIPPLKENSFYSLHFIPSFADFPPQKRGEQRRGEKWRGEENRGEESREKWREEENRREESRGERRGRQQRPAEEGTRNGCG